MMLTRCRPGQSAATFLCASRNSCSRPGLTRKRTVLKAVMISLHVLGRHRMRQRTGPGNGVADCRAAPNRNLRYQLGLGGREPMASHRFIWIETAAYPAEF